MHSFTKADFVEWIHENEGVVDMLNQKVHLINWLRGVGCRIEDLDNKSLPHLEMLARTIVIESLRG